MEVRPDKDIHFYALVPLYRQEMELKLRDGLAALESLLDRHGIGDVIDLGRPSVV